MDVKACFAVGIKSCVVFRLIFRYGHPAVEVVGKESDDENLHHHHAGALSGTPLGAFSKRHETERADNVVCTVKEPSRVEFVQGRHVIGYPFVPTLLILMQRMYADDYSCSRPDLVFPVADGEIEVFHCGIVIRDPGGS